MTVNSTWGMGVTPLNPNSGVDVPAEAMGRRLPPDGRRHEYLYVSSTLFSDIPVADLPLINVQYSWARNKPGNFSAELPVPVFARVSDYLNSTVPGKHAIYVFRDGMPVWGGIIWKRTLSSDSRMINIEGDTFDSYLYHRILDQDLAFILDPYVDPPIPGTDQIEMFRILWAHMSGRWDEIEGIMTGLPVPFRQNADIGVVLNPQPNHTTLRGRYFSKWDFRTYGEHLETLAALRDGFEWCSIVTEKAIGSPTTSGVERRIEFGFPRLGRPFSQTGFIWEYPANMLSYTWGNDADKAATAAYVVGAGEGDMKAYTVQYNTEKLNEGWPLLDVSYAHSTVYDLNVLISHAAKYLRAYEPPISTFDMTIHPDMPPTFGPPGSEQYFIGDEIGIKIDDEIFNEAGVRPEDMYVIIEGIAVSPNDDGLEDVRPQISINARNVYIPPDEEEAGDTVPEDWPGPSVDTDAGGGTGTMSYSTSLKRRIDLRQGTRGWGGSQP